MPSRSPVTALSKALGPKFVADVGRRRVEAVVQDLGLTVEMIESAPAELAASVKRAIEVADQAAGRDMDPRDVDPASQLIGHLVQEARWCEECVEFVAAEVPAGALARDAVLFVVVELRRAGWSIDDIRARASEIAATAAWGGRG